MKKLFQPTNYYNDISSIPADYFVKRGIEGVICDIDNTLINYDETHPTPEAMQFLNSLKEQGIKVVLASNNTKNRVKTFNSDLGLPAYANSTKPLSRRVFTRAMKIMGTTRDNTAVIGDQVFTDVLGTKFCGIKHVILVRPIKPASNIFSRTKRGAEQWFLKGFTNND
ncbi:MAG: YqeG family HAD IIIA-type phosphatase [Oscillospiraceae bacterium]|nr:YqeG family HAD IIIA-type phosphatase [Oscillospiraceae bacterium]